MDDLQQTNVGALLKNRRHELGLSIAEIAAKTNIRRAYLEALEEGRYEALPGEAYQRGFLRNYGGTLGLDPDGLLRQWRIETSTVSESKRGEHAVAPGLLRGAAPPRSLPRRSVFFLLPLLLVSAIALYFSLSSRHGVDVQRTATSMLVQSQLVAPIVSSPASDNQALSFSDSAAEAAAVLAEKPATAAAEALAELPAIPAEGSVIRLEAMGPLAVEVAVDSRPLQHYVLSTASALQWNVGRSARLAVDNPDAAKIWLGGEPLDLAGRSEIVLRTTTSE
jgi:cytoskeleton protein RodZ